MMRGDPPRLPHPHHRQLVLYPPLLSYNHVSNLLYEVLLINIIFFYFLLINEYIHVSFFKRANKLCTTLS